MTYPRSYFLDTVVTPTSDDKTSWSPKYRGKHPLCSASTILPVDDN
jgi:hypothetical protein